MKTICAVALIALTTVITGCDSKTPPDDLAKAVVLKAAKAELLNGMEIVDFKRENGWADQTALNRYYVRYEYNVRLAKDFPEIVLDMAKETMKDVEAAEKNPDFRITNNFARPLNMQYRASELNREKDYGQRLNTFVGRCKECWDYLVEPGGQKWNASRLRAFEASWYYMLNELNFGLKDEHTAGTKLPRRYWRAFMKTEKGWMPEG